MKYFVVIAIAIVVIATLLHDVSQVHHAGMGEAFVLVFGFIMILTIAGVIMIIFGICDFFKRRRKNKGSTESERPQHLENKPLTGTQKELNQLFSMYSQKIDEQNQEEVSSNSPPSEKDHE
jgi:Na+/melibiose symporter-like transporter